MLNYYLRRRIIFFNIWLFIAACFLACNEPKDALPKTDGSQQASGDYAEGVIVLNEGNFDWGFGTLTHLEDSADALQAAGDLFQAANGRVVGNVLQSMAVYEDKAYLVVNNSGKIEIVEPQTMRSIGVIDGLTSPRYLVPARNGFAYITDLYAEYISVYNIEREEIVGRIAAPGWTEEGIAVDGYVYIANRRIDADNRAGGNNVLKIDPEIHQVVDSVAVPQGTFALEIDRDGHLWALSVGTAVAGRPVLNKIDLATLTVIDSFDLPGEGASDLAINSTQDTLYYISGDIYAHAIEQTEISAEPLVSANGRLFYALGIDPETGMIYASDAIDYVQRGLVFRFMPDGSPIDSVRAGIIPTAFFFP